MTGSQRVEAGDGGVPVPNDWLLSVVSTVDPRPGLMPAFLSAIAEYAQARGLCIELVLVDDLAVLAGSAPSVPDTGGLLTVRVLPPAADGGHDVAVMRGVAASRGEALVCIDPDMAGNVPDIDRLLAAWRGGAELVYTWRCERADTSLPRRWLSTVFNALVRLFTRAPVHDINTPMFLGSARARAAALSDLSHPYALKLSMYFLFAGQFAEVPIRVRGAASGSNFSAAVLAGLFWRRVADMYRWWRWQR